MRGLHSEIERQASTNLERLGKSAMPGDGTVVGIDASGQRATQVLWLVSSLPKLQKRVLDYHPRVKSEENEDSMAVVFNDDSKDEYTDSPTPESLKSSINYTAMLGRGNLHVVSNGIQTHPLMEAFLKSRKIEDPALEMLSWGPYKDEVGTPRLAGVLSVLADGKVDYSVMIARKAGQNGRVEHIASPDNLGEHLGNGVGIGAYEGMDSDPRRFFMPLGESPEATVRIYRESLGEENLAALAVKSIDLATRSVEYSFMSMPTTSGNV